MQTLKTNWNKSKLEDAAQLIKDAWSPGDENTKYVGLEHINQGDLTLNGWGTSENLESNKSRFSAGDILFGKLRPYFRKVVRTDFDGVASTDIWVIRARKGYDQRYMFYFMANPTLIARSMGASTGTHMPRADWRYLGKTEWRFPEEKEQREIGILLSSLDDKIKLLREENETLKQIGRVLFREWFAEFNFPNEKGKPYKTSSGEMIESELGSIPVGWVVTSLGEIAEVIDCLHSKKPKQVFNDTGRLLLQLENITDSGLLDLSRKYFISEEDYQRWISRIEAIEGDCVITNVGRVGAVSRIPKRVRAALGRNMTAVRCKPSYKYPYFLIAFLTSELYKIEVNKNTDVGTILNALNVRNISKLQFAIPRDPMLVELVDEYTASLWQKMEANVAHLNQLSAIRDVLLPKLMTGEIRVSIQR